MIHCSVCGVTATHHVIRKHEPEPLCGEHLEWLRANVTRELVVEEIGTDSRAKHAVHQQNYYMRSRDAIRARRALKKEQARADKQVYYQANRAVILTRTKLYKRRNSDLIARTKADWYQRNRPVLLVKHAAYRLQNRKREAA